MYQVNILNMQKELLDNGKRHIKIWRQGTKKFIVDGKIKTSKEKQHMENCKHGEKKRESR